MIDYALENIPLYLTPEACDGIFRSMYAVMRTHQMPTGNVIGQHVHLSEGNLWGSAILTKIGTRHNMENIAAVRNENGTVTLGPIMEAVRHVRDGATAAIEALG